MENKEFEFKGKQLSGIAMLVLTILDLAIAIGACVAGVELEGNVGGALQQEADGKLSFDSQHLSARQGRKMDARQAP